jgi:hypothetical protein
MNELPTKAFPRAEGAGSKDRSGMDLRDYFAAAALQGYLADRKVSKTEEQLAIEVYRMADAMMAQRDKK